MKISELRNYAQMFTEFCKRREQKFLVNYTGLSNTVSQTYMSIIEVTDLKLILR